MDRSIVDWMFEHPWMTFFIASSLASAFGASVARVTRRS